MTDTDDRYDFLLISYLENSTKCKLGQIISVKES